jgi:ABC-2 type transport system permease protein
MQTQLKPTSLNPALQNAATHPIARGSDMRPIVWRELWRGGWVIFRKHLYKFRHDRMELGGTLAWPLLWVATFGLGMERVVNVDALGVSSYLAFITPGIIALTALSGAVNAGMVLLEEKIKGILKEYFVAPIPRMSILLASTGSGLVKSLLQSSVILIIALLLGAQLAFSGTGLPLALLYLFLYIFAFVGFSNGVAARSKSTGAYHMLLFVLNLPLLFLSNALYPLDAMPLWMRVLAYLNPTTYVVDGLRQSLFGAGDLPTLLNLGVLIAFVALCSRFGLASFRRLSEQN